MRLELTSNHIANLIRQIRKPSRRQLFATDLEEQFAVHELRQHLRFSRLNVGFCDADGQLPDPQDVGSTLGHPDAVARVENVEEMRTLEAVLQRRPDQSGIQQRLCKAIVPVE